MESGWLDEELPFAQMTSRLRYALGNVDVKTWRDLLESRSAGEWYNHPDIPQEQFPKFDWDRIPNFGKKTRSELEELIYSRGLDGALLGKWDGPIDEWPAGLFRMIPRNVVVAGL